MNQSVVQRMVLFAGILAMGWGSSVAHAKSSAEKAMALNSWSKSALTELTRDCAKLTHAEWVKRYRDKSVEVMSQTKDMSSEAFADLAEESPARTLVGELFPQHVPMRKGKRPPNLCFATLDEFLEEKDPARRRDLPELFESCNEDRHGGRRSEAVKRVVSCWKALKN